jgi:hypothetical protein
MKIKNSFLLIFLLVVQQWSFSQLISLSSIKIPVVRSTKAGPYIGFQKGKYNVIEFGGEIQFKKIKLVHPQIHAFRFGPNYDFKEHVLGFDLAYWHQQSRLGLTYGAILSHRTNFDQSRIGIAPVLGFRLLQFHLQTGFTFLTKAQPFVETNNFFIALKFTMINKRKINFKKRSKGGK